jgi:ketosteroid isomerase-like protein
VFEEENTMGEAREVMDRITAALDAQDVEAAAECYATDAVAETPDQGQIRGREAIAEYFRQLADAFPDVRYEPQHGHESGNVAIDEGYVVGTHTAPLSLPSGESVPATGQEIMVRSLLASRMVWRLATASTSTRWSFSDNLGCFLRCRPKPD